MKAIDKYTLRISNANNSDGITESTDKSTFTINLPNNLKNRGKCYVRVVGGLIQLKNAAGNSILAANTRVISLSSNIPMLGYDTETRGGGNTILGTGFILDDNTDIVELDAPDAGFGFTCPSLPDQITIEKIFIDPTTNKYVLANTNTLDIPATIELEITFYNDFIDK